MSRGGKGKGERKGAQNQTKGKGRTIDGENTGANGQGGRKDGESAKGKRGAKFPPVKCYLFSVDNMRIIGGIFTRRKGAKNRHTVAVAPSLPHHFFSPPNTPFPFGIHFGKVSHNRMILPLQKMEVLSVHNQSLPNPPNNRAYFPKSPKNHKIGGIITRFSFSGIAYYIQEDNIALLV